MLNYLLSISEKFFHTNVMKSLIMLMTFIGVISIVVGYINQIKKCPPPKVEYRYIPRTFEEDQNNPVKISELFNTMFVEPTPWLDKISSSAVKNAEINRYYISQA
jgi:hypothetical protein